MPRYRAVIAIQYLNPIAAFVERARVIQPAPGVSAIRKQSACKLTWREALTCVGYER
jgi:hypothetical protein